MNNVKQRRPVTEQVTLVGSELIGYVKKLVAQGNARRLIIRRPNGKFLLGVPLTAGLAVSGVLTLIAPVLTALGAMAALLAQVRVEVIRSGDSDD